MIQFYVHECDTFPDARMLEAFPNWIDDLTGTSRFVIDGCHVKPQKQAERVQSDTRYSVGDVWFADGNQVVALMKVADGYALGIIIYDKSMWGLARQLNNRDFYDPLRFRLTKQWILCELPLGHPGFENPQVFPLRYCSRLSCTATRASIHGTIGNDGVDSPWSE